MKERLYKIINIKFSESNQVFDLLSVQFFIGLANAFVNIIAFTLFIYNFPITTLPEIYVEVAVILFLMNMGYEKLEHRFKPIPLMKIILGVSASIIILLWIGLAGGDKNTFIYLFLIASMLLYMLTGYAFWGMVSLLFNVRESKRIFSVVGSGDIPAKLLGYITVPFLIKLVGLVNVLWFAAASLLFALYLFNKYTHKITWKRLKEHHVEHEHHHHNVRKDIISFFFGHKLIFAISLLSIISYNVFILIDYTFLSQVKTRFVDIAALATYVSIFFAIGRVIAMVFKIIFTSRVIDNLGVIRCLFITPVILLLFCLVLIYLGYDNKYSIYIFGVMAMLTEVLRSTMQEPVFFILFQPLKEQLRLKGHIISKGYMYPPSLIIVGASIWFFHRKGYDMTIVQSVKIVLANLLVWAAVIFFIGKAYLKTIHTSIKKGMFSGTGIHVYDQQTINILLDKISTENPRDTIYALDLLEKAGYDNINNILQQQLKFGNSDIQKYALLQLDLKGKVDVEILKEILPAADAEIYPSFVNVLCKYDPDFLDEMAAQLSTLHYNVRKDIIIQLLEKREFRHLIKAGTEIQNLIVSENIKEQELAIDIISEMKHLKFDDVILNMINNGSHTVKRKAILAACKLKLKSLLPLLLKLLSTTSDRYITLKGLLLYGDTLFEHLHHLSNTDVKTNTADLIKTAGKIKGMHSKEYLVQFIHRKEIHSDKVVHALWSREFIPENKTERSLLLAVLQRHINEGLQKIEDVRLIHHGHYKDIVMNSVYNEINDHLICSLKICSMLFDKKEVNRVLELLQLNHQGKIYHAMEMLDLVLPKKTATDINNLFEFVLDPAATLAGKAVKGEFFKKVLYQDSVLYNSWTKSICVYYSWKTAEHHVLNKLNELNVEDDNHILRETQEFVLKELNTSKYADHRKNSVTEEL